MFVSAGIEGPPFYWIAAYVAGAISTAVARGGHRGLRACVSSTAVHCHRRYGMRIIVRNSCLTFAGATFGSLYELGKNQPTR